MEVTFLDHQGPTPEQEAAAVKLIDTFNRIHRLTRAYAQLPPCYCGQPACWANSRKRVVANRMNRLVWLLPDLMEVLNYTDLAQESVYEEVAEMLFCAHLPHQRTL